MPIIAAIIGALLYRLRGGWLKDMIPGIGTQASRLVWAVPTAALMTEMSHSPWWMIPLLSATNFTALALFGTGQYLRDVPLKATPDWLGLARNSLAAIPLVLYSPLMFGLYAASGALHAVFYWLGHKTGYRHPAGECIVGGASWLLIAMCR